MRLTTRQWEMLERAAADRDGFAERWPDNRRTGESLCAKGLMREGRKRSERLRTTVAPPPGFYIADEGRRVSAEKRPASITRRRGAALTPR
jgi:hypothetical protein